MTSVSSAIESADPARGTAEPVEPRLVGETGIAARIAAITAPVLADRFPAGAGESIRHSTAVPCR